MAIVLASRHATGSPMRAENRFNATLMLIAAVPDCAISANVVALTHVPRILSVTQAKSVLMGAAAWHPNAMTIRRVRVGNHVRMAFV